ncbi:unannotated protein [freshwater metagenome]|uniref:Unannotated protein n=1 Tax=freshwater metagenome TaxID=449393 RepID=A0A6J7C1H6_9ZZZZ
MRKIYEALYGITGSTIDPAKSVLVGGAPNAVLPTVGKDGTPEYPVLPTPEVPVTSSPSPSGSISSAPSAPSAPSPSAGLIVLPVAAGFGLLGRAARRRHRSGASWPWMWWR